MHEGRHAVSVGLDVGRGEHHACAWIFRAGGCTTNPWPRTKHETADSQNGRRRAPLLSTCRRVLVLLSSSDAADTRSVGVAAQVAAEVGDRERDPTPLAGVDQPLLHQRVPRRRQRLRLLPQHRGNLRRRHGVELDGQR